MMLKTQLEIALESVQELIKQIEEPTDRDLFIDHIIDDVVLKEKLEVIKGYLEEYKKAEESK